jgi:gamma-glutamyltranspeptidase/glutathione hydrolase
MTLSRREFLTTTTAGLLLADEVMLHAEPDRDAQSTKGMVVSVSEPGSRVGAAILKRGGNAVDAAVATALALAVTHPAAGNIGGGGFMIVQPPKAPASVFDYRETAPAAATKDMFGTSSDVHNHRAVGVPGTVRGLALAHSRFGKLPWKELVAPAAILAGEGFAIDASLANSLNGILASSKKFAELQRVFAPPAKKQRWEAGDPLVQKDLAWSLEQMATGGPDAFYTGPIADKLVAEMKAGEGLITKKDLAGYEARQRKPIQTSFRDCTVLNPPPPSSGGICLGLMLNMLEGRDLREKGRWSADTLHLLIEVMRRAYAERARYLGDPDFTKIPDYLTTKDHAALLMRNFFRDKASRSEDIARDIPLAPGSNHTTHFSVMDAGGMAVSNTYTLENSYGARVVVRGAGFLLNNEMGDFNWQPGVTDRTGRIGTDANLIAPGKRMLSSQTPTIVTRGGQPILITGSPGGRTIINTVLQVLLNVLEFGMDARAAVDAPRLHHQWFPDEFRFEAPAEHKDALAKLEALGHKPAKRSAKQGDAHTIQIEPKTGVICGVADRRIWGSAIGV